MDRTAARLALTRRERVGPLRASRARAPDGPLPPEAAMQLLLQSSPGTDVHLRRRGRGARTASWRGPSCGRRGSGCPAGSSRWRTSSRRPRGCCASWATASGRRTRSSGTSRPRGAGGAGEGSSPSRSAPRRGAAPDGRRGRRGRGRRLAIDLDELDELDVGRIPGFGGISHRGNLQR